MWEVLLVAIIDYVLIYIRSRVVADDIDLTFRGDGAAY